MSLSPNRVGNSIVFKGCLYGLQGGNVPWFMCSVRRCINSLFVCLLNFLLTSFTFFFPYAYVRTYLLLYLFTSWLFCLLLPGLAHSACRQEVVGGFSFFYFLTCWLLDFSLSTSSKIDRCDRPEVVGGDQTWLSFFWFILCRSIFCYGCMFAFVVFVSVFQY